jgi:hypothetical protein
VSTPETFSEAITSPVFVPIFNAIGYVACVVIIGIVAIYVVATFARFFDDIHRIATKNEEEKKL